MKMVIWVRQWDGNGAALDGPFLSIQAAQDYLGVGGVGRNIMVEPLVAAEKRLEQLCQRVHDATYTSQHLADTAKMFALEEEEIRQQIHGLPKPAKKKPAKRKSVRS